MTLEASLDTDVTDDGDVEFVFHVVNAGTEPIELTFRSGQVADVAVYATDADDSGDPVWRWSDERMFTQAIETETLAPDQMIEQIYTWEDPPSGKYTAVATLEADRDVEARTSFEILG